MKVENAEKEYVYLDWNVIKYMKEKLVGNIKKDKDRVDGNEFAKLVKAKSNRYYFPASEGHLVDLAQSYYPENVDKIYSDINYLEYVTNGYVLGIVTRDGYESLEVTEKVKIRELFKEVFDSKKNQSRPELTVNMLPYHIDMNMLSSNNIFRAVLERNNGVLDGKVLSKVMEDLYDTDDNPGLYKQFRNDVLEIKTRIETGNTIASRNSILSTTLFTLIDFLECEMPESSQVESVIKIFCSLSGRDFEEITEGHKIEIIYMILDFHPQFKEKIKGNNKSSNIMRDCKNFFFASQARYYITEDKNTRKKSKFVAKSLGLKVKIESMSEFMRRFD